MTAKELIANISNTINHSREDFEEWMVEYPALSYRKAKDSASSDLGKWGLSSKSAGRATSPEREIPSSSPNNKRGGNEKDSLLKTIILNNQNAKPLSSKSSKLNNNTLEERPETERGKFE